MERFPNGDAWVVEGVEGHINFGNNAAGGLGPEKRTGWAKWEEVRASGYEPGARLKAMDEDGVHVELLYPTPRISTGLFLSYPDPEFHLSLLRAYNDWLSDFCRHSPERLIGLALMPNVNSEMAVEEFQRAMKLPGIGGIVIGRYPSGGEDISAADDQLWAAAQEAAVPVSIHVSLALNKPDDPTTRKKGVAEFRFTGTLPVISDFVYSGVFDRFPNLRVVLAEVDCGWVPYVKEQMDDRHKRYHPKERAPLSLKPSEYLERNFFYTYITDSYGVTNRKAIGVEQIMWSSDFPHSGTDFPKSRDTIERVFAIVPPDEKYQILVGNAARVYDLKLPQDLSV